MTATAVVIDQYDAAFLKQSNSQYGPTDARRTGTCSRLAARCLAGDPAHVGQRTLLCEISGNIEHTPALWWRNHWQFDFRPSVA